MLKPTLLVLAGVILLSGQHATAAEGDRVGLVTGDPTLRGAVEKTLEPWRLTVVIVEGEDPGAVQPAATVRAETIANAQKVAALIWLSQTDGGNALWVYDAKSGRLISRTFRDPLPLDEVAAAALALTIKTMLRHSLVAPPLERFGAAASAAPEREARLRFSGLWGTRLTGTGAEPRLGAQVHWWPIRLGGDYGVGLTIRSGPGVAVGDTGFFGHHADTSVGASARARRALVNKLEMVVSLGATVRFSSLDGGLLEQDTAVSVRRINPSVDAAIEIGWRLGPVRIGGHCEGSYLLERQEYLVSGETVLELSARELHVGVTLDLPLL